MVSEWHVSVRPSLADGSTRPCPLGYHVVVYDRDAAGGGMMRSQIPAFRLPESVLNEEVERILDFGIETRFNQEVTSLKGS